MPKYQNSNIHFRHKVQYLHVALAFLVLLTASSLILIPNSKQVQAQDPPLVLAFYYAWFDQNTWNSNLVTDQPSQPYTSSDPATIERHVTEAQAAGIDALIQSWYGPQEENNQTETNFRQLLDIASAKGFRAAIDFETVGPFFPDQTSVTNGLRVLLNTHAQHPAYLRHQGKPVIFFWRQNRFSVEEWADIRSEIDPDHNSLWIAEGVDITYQAVFDGHHLYSTAWSPDLAHTLTDWSNRIQGYETDNGTNRLWVATAMPGYNDTGTDRADAFAVNRDSGDYYRASWSAATASHPDWIVITSFNEWIEGSMIEPSQSYGSLYLDLTREESASFKAGFLTAEDDRAAPVAEAESATVPNTPENLPPPQTDPAPEVKADETVRIRSGPGTEFGQIGRLAQGRAASVTGQNHDRSWWQIRPADFMASQGIGWVTAEFVTFSGDTDLVPVITDFEQPPDPTEAVVDVVPSSVPPEDSTAETPATTTPISAPISPQDRPNSTASPRAATAQPRPSSNPTREHVVEAIASADLPTNAGPVEIVEAEQAEPPGAKPSVATLGQEKKTTAPFISWIGAMAILVGAVALISMLFQAIQQERQL